jgi:predicted negative regulator of RcsB-dependent stress response
MTMNKHLERDLKGPDSLQKNLSKSIESLASNRKRLLMMLSPIFVVAIAAYGVYAWSQHNVKSRRAGLAKILAVRGQEDRDLSKRREDIQKQITELRNTKTEKDGKKAALSPEALTKVTSLEKQMADLKPDYSKSHAEFKKFYDSNSRESEGWMAGLSWAGKELREGRNDEARKVIEHVAKSSTSNKFYQMNSRFMLIGLLEEAGDFDGALKECDVLSKISSEETQATVLLTKARLLYFKKSFDQAKVSLNELLTKHASTPEATKARGLLALMGQA